MHLASANGHIQIVQFLLRLGMNVNPRDRWGATPLNDAHSEDMVEYLVSKGAVKGAD